MRVLLLACMIILSACTAASADVNGYLILGDIGQYKHVTREWHPLAKVMADVPPYVEGVGSGKLRGSGHFWGEHLGNDQWYETDYRNAEANLSVEVQVTQHAGGESDRWLLHELEGKFRSEDDLNETFDGVIKEFDGNKIMTYLYGGYYAWLSGNVLVHIEYTDLQLEKPEPLEVVRTYLHKHPSTLTLSDVEMKTNEHDKQWIKDEMERRIWLCDKWLAAYAAQKVEAKDLLYELQNSLDVFLQFAEKYYGKDVKDDRVSLEQYQYVTRNVDDMKKKHAELKAWWTSHKDDSSVMKMFRKLIP